MKKIIYQKRYWVIGLLIILILGMAPWYFSSEKKSDKNFSIKEKVWQTVPAEISRDFSSIKIPGKVKSNKFAIISPRRTGIIQDLLVDIGDEVYKGQTIGSMLPEGVEGQGSAAIAEASARLQKAKAELSNLEGVAVGAISVASKQWRENNLKSQTQATLDEESKKQLEEKKSEAVLVTTQAWENIKIILFGSGTSINSRDIKGNFANSIQENKVETLADEIQRMEESGEWNNPDKIIEHLSHLENFLSQTEILYKTANSGQVLTESQISANLIAIQNQQLKVSKIKQGVLSLEEKNKLFSSVQAEKEAGEERSLKVLDLVKSQQDLTTTQAEKNVAVALANYNSALVKSGHQSITSPFSGVITARMVEVGQAVSPNMALFYLEGAATSRAQESLFEVHFSLPESWKNRVKTGDFVEISSVEGEKFAGKIFRLSSQINLATHSIMATAILDIPNNEDEVENILPEIDLTHGQSVFVSVNDFDSSIFTIPTLALKKRSNNYFIWKMENENPVQIEVEVLAEDGEFSQVFSRDLQAEALVISNPSVSLFKKSE